MVVEDGEGGNGCEDGEDDEISEDEWIGWGVFWFHDWFGWDGCWGTTTPALIGVTGRDGLTGKEANGVCVLRA